MHPRGLQHPKGNHGAGSAVKHFAQRLRTDVWLFAVISGLMMIGILMVYSASVSLSPERFQRAILVQTVCSILGFGVLFFLMSWDYRKLCSRHVVLSLLLLTVLLLIAVFFFPPRNGARRWIELPLSDFQSAEFAKLTLIVFLAWYLEQYGTEINRPKVLLTCGLPIVIILGLIQLQPDLGTVLCLAVVCGLLLFLARLKWIYILGAVLASLPFLYWFLFRVPFRMKRLLAFLDPFGDPLNSSYHIRQSLMAVGNGGALGLGLGESKAKLFFLPESNTDFIFAVIGEELGLWGTLLVLTLFAILCWRGLRAALRAPDLFGAYLALGLTLMIVLQALINMSVTLSLVPTKGITLPFISKGGSSLLMSAISAGLLLNVAQEGQ